MLSYAHTVSFQAAGDPGMSRTARVMIVAGSLAAIAAVTYVGAKSYERGFRRLNRRR